ncbi:restriction endonuclease subunit S [Roseateles sp. P5_D6]
MQEPILFSDLIAETKDGEWGEGQEAPGHVLCDVIRGTDFADLHAPGIELPQRWIPEHLVARKALAADDILIETAGGTAKQSTGRTALITKEFLASRGGRPVLCSSFARHLRVDPAKAHTIYLYYVLQALYGSGYMGVFNLQHTGVARFQFTAFRTKTRLTLHESAAQPRIAATLKSYDDLIANNQRRIALLESMAEEIYREWFVRMRFPGYERAEFFAGRPVAWQPRRLGQVLQLRYGKALPEGQRVPGPYRVYGSAGVVGTHSEALVTKPSIVVGRKGNVGSIFWASKPFYPIDTVYYVESELPLIYLRFLLAGMNFINSDAAVPGLNREQAYANEVLLPQDSLLSRFEEVVGPLYRQLGALEDQVACLGSTRDALLPRLISGKLRVEALDIQFPPSMQQPPAEAAQREAIAR